MVFDIKHQSSWIIRVIWLESIFSRPLLILSHLLLLQSLPPDSSRSCSTAAWLNLTLRQKHKPAARHSELQAIRIASAVSFLLEASLSPTCWRSCFPRMLKNKTFHGQSGEAPSHNICESYHWRVRLKRGRTSHMTHQEGANCCFLFKMWCTFLQRSMNVFYEDII